jgi:hypothetical protein
MQRYAQINAASKCIALSDLPTTINDPFMIAVADNENPLGKLYQNGQWADDPQVIDVVIGRQQFVELFGLKQQSIIAAAQSGSPVYDWEVSTLWQWVQAMESFKIFDAQTGLPDQRITDGVSMLESKGFVTDTEKASILSGVAI